MYHFWLFIYFIMDHPIIRPKKTFFNSTISLLLSCLPPLQVNTHVCLVTKYQYIHTYIYIHIFRQNKRYIYVHNMEHTNYY